MIIIPARGGSKRIPNKNIVQLGGRPLISYTIETCLEITPDVFVSTDSEEIAACAKNFGAQIIKRPAATLNVITVSDAPIASPVTGPTM